MEAKKQFTIKYELKSLWPLIDFDLIDWKRNNSIIGCVGRRHRPYLAEIAQGLMPCVKITIDSNFKGITGLWSLKKHSKEFHHIYLALSFLNSSTLLSLAEEQEIQDIIHDTSFREDVRSILFANLESSGLIIQVHEGGVVVCRPGSDQAGLTMTSPDRISCASVHGNLLCLYKGSSKCLELFDFCHKNPDLKKLFGRSFEEEISCVEFSKKGDLLLCGTFDSKLLFINLLKDGIVDRVIDLDGKIAHKIHFYHQSLLIGTRDGCILIDRGEDKLERMECGTLPVSFAQYDDMLIVKSDACYFLNPLNDRKYQLVSILQDRKVRNSLT